MATYLVRANDIIEGAIDSVPTAEQKQRIAAAAIKYRPDLLLSIAVDPENPTNEEKAHVFVQALREWGKSWLRAEAEKDARSDNAAVVQAAGDTAAGDL